MYVVVEESRHGTGQPAIIRRVPRYKDNDTISEEILLQCGVPIGCPPISNTLWINVMHRVTQVHNGVFINWA